MIPKWLFGLLLFSFLSTFCAAQNSTARFLFFSPSAKVTSMGGAGAAYTDDAFAAYYNPAGLAFAPALTAVASFNKPFPFFENIAHSFSGISFEAGNIGTFSLAANLYWKGGQLILSDSGEQLDLTSEDYLLNRQLKLNFARRFSPNLAIGAGVGLTRVNLAANDRTFGVNEEWLGIDGFTMDAGVLFQNIAPGLTYRAGEQTLKDDELVLGLSIGAALLNTGSFTNELDGNTNNAPARFIIGSQLRTIHIEDIKLHFAGDLEKRLHEDGTFHYFHLGMETLFLDIIAVRSGRYIAAQESLKSYFTIGGGIETRYFSLNFARYTHALQGVWHFDAAIRWR